MKTITLKLTIEITEKEGDLVMPNYPHQLNASNIKSNGKYDLEILDVDKFRKFLNDKILGAEFYRKTNPRKYYLMKADNVVFKSVLSKLDKEVNK